MLRASLVFLVVASLAEAQSALYQLLDNPIPASTSVQAAGDLDGDGDRDLLIPDGVMVNDGHGRFTKVPVAALTFQRVGARLVDLNGDGLCEVVSLVPASFTPQHLRIDFNTGAAFATSLVLMPGSLPGGAVPVSFAAGDVDGDADGDILVGTFGGGTPTHAILWRNDGVAGFTLAPAALPGTTIPTGLIRLADLDADGDLDALFADAGQNTAGLIMAVNTGGLFIPLTAPVWNGGPVTSIEIGRFNADGLLDIIFCSGYTAAVVLNSPTGFLAPSTTTLHSGAGFGNHAPIDVNGDGIDEVLQWTSPRNVALRPVSPGGTLGPPIQAWTDLELYHYGDHDPIVADLDGDGDEDAVALTARESIALMNLGTGSLVRTGGRLIDVQAQLSLNVGDLDADGDADLLGLEAGAQILTGFNDGDGFVTAGPITPLQPTWAGSTLRTFDRDGDGDLDIYAMRIYPTPGVPAPDIVLDNSGGIFTQIGTVPGTGDGRSFEVADFEGDGDQDFVIGSWAVGSPRGMTYVANLGTGALALPVIVGGNHYIYDVDLADFDGNGTIDILQSNASPWLIAPYDLSVIYLNAGNGAFTAVVQSFMGHFTAAGDINGDAMPDLVTDGQVMLNTGGGSFIPGPVLPSPLMGPASLADVDLDGDLDLVETPATVMFNAGGVFGPPQSYLPRVTAAQYTAEIARTIVVDLDHDGDPDIVAPGPVIFMNTTRQIAHGSIPRPGRPASIDLYGTPGGGWFLFASDGTTSLPLPPLGTVLIDPASAQLFAMGTFAPQAAPLPGTASIGATVPSNPALIGWTTWWQSVDAAQLRLTNRIKITVMGF